MSETLQGFKTFFIESEQSPVDIESGAAELGRLEKGHRLYVLPMNHVDAAAYMNDRVFLGAFSRALPITSEEIRGKLPRLNINQDTLMFLSFPKRWQRQLGRNDEAILPRMVGESPHIARYIWGTFSLWNPRIEQHDTGNFFRNPQYHANDELLEQWLKNHPSPIREKQPIPLDRAPRVMGYHLLDQGRHSFHGYSDPENSLMA